MNPRHRIQHISQTGSFIERVLPAFALALVGALFIFVSIAWLDRPIARFFHAVSPRPHGHYFRLLLEGPNPLGALAVLMLVVSAAWAIVSRRGLSLYPRMGLAAGIADLLTDAVKSELKFVFGRTWPDSWHGQHPSFLADGAYGFHPFTDGGAYQSFPSGHMAIACAILAVLWVYMPAWRLVIACITAAIGAALVAWNFHFLSDVVAGALLGILIAWATLYGMQRLLPASERR